MKGPQAMSDVIADTPYLNRPPRSEAEYRAELRAKALERAREVVDAAETKLRGLLMDAAGDKEACEAIQSALDGLHDYGHEIHVLIAAIERDSRILRLEQIDRELEDQHTRGLASLNHKF
jgi:hypothetical protein